MDQHKCVSPLNVLQLAPCWTANPHYPTAATWLTATCTFFNSVAQHNVLIACLWPITSMRIGLLVGVGSGTPHAC